MTGQLVPLEVLAGVESSADRRGTTTRHYTDAKGIRFVDGFPEKIGGWQSLTFDGNELIEGVVRSIFSYKLNEFTRYLVGTSSNLYDIFGSSLTNITPVKTATIAIANSLDTYYDTLANDPIATTDGSTTITFTDTAHKFQAGDTVTISGSTAVNGVPAVEINVDHFVRATTTNTFDVIVNTAASSTGSGGGASVVRSSGYITVNAASHGLSDGDRVKINDAATTGGILDTEINLEFLIRNTDTNTFDIYTEGTATSSVTSGGGASTTYQEPIDEGSVDTLLGQGYGMGLYGAGLYGVSKTSSGSATLPRRWSHDRFGDLTISAVGNGGGVYSWDGNTAEAPMLITNAPTEVNYAFVSDNICVVLGYDTGQASANSNGISWSDQGELTDWTTGQSGSDTIEGAGKFISHASVRGENILFTENQCYTFRYIGGEFIWRTRLLDQGIGLIAQNARVAASGNLFWMSQNNFYMWRGGNVEVIPSNSSSESTILHYVFDDINFSQKEKIYAWYNSEFREVWFHYPSVSSNEPDRIARVNIDTFAWTYDFLDRTAAEYPSILSQTPYLSDDNSVIFLHENGLNDNGAGMEWRFSLNFEYGGTNQKEFAAFIPDHVITQTATVNMKTRNYPLSPNIYNNDYTITSTSDRVATEINGRFVQVSVSGDDLDQEYESAQWYFEVKDSSTK